MTAHQEQLIVDLEKTVDDIETIKQGLTNALSAALEALDDSLFSPPSWTMNWLRSRCNDAISDFNSAAAPAQNFCNECIVNTRHCFEIRAAEHNYRVIDFADAIAKTKASTIAGDANSAWVSGNRDEYVSRLREMEGRVQRVQGSLEELVESLTQMAQAMEDRDVDVAIAIASMALTIAGIIVTCVTGFTGVGAVIGVVLAVIGLALTIWSLIRITGVVPNRLSEMINELTSNAQTVSSDSWPTAPRLLASDW